MTTDEKYIRRCIQLARNGLCNAAPNPMVGAVIVYQGRIIGEGYHARCGEGHAEVNAIRSVKDESLLKDSTIYVSLEPCSHYGKTPPCADLIIRKGIPRVVVGCTDPFPLVAGRGIRKLKEAGVDVKVGVLEEECKALIKRFVTQNISKRPYITLKWAQSADGFIDVERTSGQPVVLSTPITSMYVHKQRAEHQAILVGRRTALLDNPSLTVRNWYGKNPLRLVIGAQPDLCATGFLTRYPSTDHERADRAENTDFAGRRRKLSAPVLPGRRTLGRYLHRAFRPDSPARSRRSGSKEGLPLRL